MKKLLLLLIIPFLSFGQNLTYVPDNAFEEYIETNFPNADNGIDNDNFVFTSGLNFQGAGIYLYPQYLNDPIFDFTGIEDFRGDFELNIDQQLMTSLDLSAMSIDAEGDLPDGTLPGWISVKNCPLLESVTLPHDTLRWLEISGNTSLSNILFMMTLFMPGEILCLLILIPILIYVN